MMKAINIAFDPAHAMKFLNIETPWSTWRFHVKIHSPWGKTGVVRRWLEVECLRYVKREDRTHVKETSERAAVRRERRKAADE